MSWDCLKCGYSSEDQIEECPDCGGGVEEKEPEIDWLGEGQKKSGKIKKIPSKDQK